MYWRTPDPIGDRFVRDNDTHVYEGHDWFYCYSARTTELRRYSKKTDQVDVIAKTWSMPPTPQRLTQIFYNKRHSPRYANHKPRYSPPGHTGRWQGSRTPRVGRLDPSALDLDQLTLAYNRLHPTAQISKFSSYTSALRRVDQALIERHLTLVTHLPGERVGGITIADLVHIIRLEDLPLEDLPRTTRDPLFDRDLVVSSLLPNPKRPGSRSWERYEHWELGLSVGEYIQLCARDGYTRARAAQDVQHDVEHEFIVLMPPPSE